MLPIILSMAAGIAIGLATCEDKKTVHISRRLLSFFTAILMLAMGLWMGASPALWHSLSTIGFAGVLFALLCTAGSIVAVHLVVRLFLGGMSN